MSRNVRKRNFGYLRTAEIQIIRSLIWTLLGAFWIAKGAKFLHECNKDSDQTTRMRKLIWVFAWRTRQKVHSPKLRLNYCSNFRANTAVDEATVIWWRKIFNIANSFFKPFHP